MLKHLSKTELMAYAEAQAGGNAQLEPRTLRHLSKCATCRAEAAAMRRSLAFVATAPALEPTAEAYKNILLAARHERAKQSCGACKTVFRFAKGMAYAAALILISVVSLQSVLHKDAPEPAAREAVAARTSSHASATKGEDLQKTSAEIQRLAAAVNAREVEADSVEEWQQRRRVVAFDADLMAARAALESNPGCARAQSVVSANLKRQAEALRALYVSL